MIIQNSKKLFFLGGVLMFVGSFAPSVMAGAIQGGSTDKGGGTFQTQPQSQPQTQPQAPFTRGLQPVTRDEPVQTPPVRQGHKDDNELQIQTITQLSLSRVVPGSVSKSGINFNPAGGGQGMTGGGLGSPGERQGMRVQGRTQVDTDLRGGVNSKSDGHVNKNNMNIGGMQDQ
ncbi:MAG: hypothetical protein H7839_06150 [Magnetococcus sp. YQC-5]